MSLEAQPMIRHVLRFPIAALTGLLLAVSCSTHARGSWDLSATGPHAVAVFEFPDLSDPSRSEPAPATTRRSPLFPRLLRFQHPPDAPVGRKVPIKVHLPTAEGTFPVVLVSHGAGGDWDTHYAQAQHLASHGFAVLCLEHTGSNRERLSQGLRPMEKLEGMIHDSHEIFARPADVDFAIHQAMAWNRSNQRLMGRLDLEHIGVMGHSFGAFTTMVVCGMRPALDWLTPPVPPGKGLGPSLRNARVTCGVALSPQGVGEPFFIQHSFASLQAPLLGISGTQDKQQNGLPASNRRDAFRFWPKGPHQFLWLEDARHLDFTDSAGAERHATPSPTRKHVQPTVRAATLLFFNLHLKGHSDLPTPITPDTLNPYLRGSLTRLELLSK